MARPPTAELQPSSEQIYTARPEPMNRGSPAMMGTEEGSQLTVKLVPRATAQGVHLREEVASWGTRGVALQQGPLLHPSV